MTENGALGAMMTGSGPTVFAFFADSSAMHECAEKLEESDLCETVHESHTHNEEGK